MPFCVEWGPGLFDAPLAVVSLDLGVKVGSLTDAFEVVFHPFKQVLTPIPTGHVVNGFTSITRFLIVVFGPLIRIVVFPLAQHPAHFVTCIDVGLIPMRPGWAAEDLVGVNIPILHALHPVDAAVVFAQGFVDVAAFIVVVVHVRVKFTQTVSGWTGEETFEDIGAHVVEVVAVIIENGTPVIRVHDLTAGLGAPVFVQQRAQGGRTGNGYDGLQVLAALSCCFPCGRALVGFSINRHVAVAPVLSSKPLHRFVDALAFPITTVIETSCAFLGCKHGDLSQSITVRNEIIVNELPPATANHIGWTGLTAR